MNDGWVRVNVWVRVSVRVRIRARVRAMPAMDDVAPALHVAVAHVFFKPPSRPSALVQCRSVHTKAGPARGRLG